MDRAVKAAGIAVPAALRSSALISISAVGAHFGFEIGGQMGRSSVGFSDCECRHQFFNAATAQRTVHLCVPSLNHFVESVVAICTAVFK